MRRLRPGPVILCADDYGMSAGVSRGIAELAASRRLTALSAMVTLPRWHGDAAALAGLRDRVAIGLHLNLTLGAPLGPMPRLAPDGRLPGIGALMAKAFRRDIDRAEVRAEVLRQLVAFEAATGCKPDHVDGHQHAHVLPGVRSAVLDAMAEFYGRLRPLIRDPGDRLFSISGRGGEMAKAYTVAALSLGLAHAAHRRGFHVNAGFSGFSAFDTSREFDIEIAGHMRLTGLGHMVMCHPGYPDAELATLDPVTERRGQELAVIRDNRELELRIWHPDRVPDAAILDWGALLGHGR